ncbi:hypothetical protein C823_005353 [Eubacterium plexicaudatum ASF492]|uniref:Uncharacterized protein n=1 Tax=Eubacterium plexicaudatum ASF492 TaxID=1235802 RepID=N2BAY4_9FIRM|nr:hypothetical protein C823_005353 [Eubacterium plexicaudatum ASF492]
MRKRVRLYLKKKAFFYKKKYLIKVCQSVCVKKNILHLGNCLLLYILLLRKCRGKGRRYIQDDHILGATQREIAESLWKVRKQEVMGKFWDEVEQDEIQDCRQEKAEL